MQGGTQRTVATTWAESGIGRRRPRIVALLSLLLLTAALTASATARANKVSAGGPWNISPVGAVAGSAVTATCAGNGFRRTYEYTVQTQIINTQSTFLVTWGMGASGKKVAARSSDTGRPVSSEKLTFWVDGGCEEDAAASVNWQQIAGGNLNVTRGGAPNDPSVLLYPRWKLITNVVDFVRETLGLVTVAKGTMQTAEGIVQFFSEAHPVDPSAPESAWVYQYKVISEGASASSSRAYTETLFGQTRAVPGNGVDEYTVTAGRPCGVGPGQLTFTESGESFIIGGIVPSGCPSPPEVPAGSDLSLGFLALALGLSGTLIVARRRSRAAA